MQNLGGYFVQQSAKSSKSLLGLYKSSHIQKTCEDRQEDQWGQQWPQRGRFEMCWSSSANYQISSSQILFHSVVVIIIEIRVPFMSFLGGKFAFTRSYVDRTAMVCSATATASDSVVVVVVLIVCSGAPLVRVLLPTPRSKACSYTSWRSSAKAAVQHGSKLGIDFWRAQERLLLGLLFAPAKLTV